MDLMPRSESPESERMAQALAGLSTVSASDAVARLRQALRRAADPATSEAESERLDLAVVRAFVSAIDPDPWLGSLTVDELGGLFDRSLARLSNTTGTPALKRAVLDLLDLLRLDLGPGISSVVGLESTYDRPVGAWAGRDRPPFEPPRVTHCCDLPC